MPLNTDFKGHLSAIEVIDLCSDDDPAPTVEVIDLCVDDALAPETNGGPSSKGSEPEVSNIDNVLPSPTTLEYSTKTLHGAANFHLSVWYRLAHLTSQTICYLASST